MNDILSICIPTYNRRDQLKENLENLIPIISKYEIPVIISDNCSTDDTKDVVLKARGKYPYIVYSCNEENIGMDRNFDKVLKLAQTEYAWLLGDDDTIRKDVYPILEKLQKEKPDLLFLGDPKVVGDIKEGIYEDKEIILYKFATGGLSWISADIFSRNMIEKSEFERYHGTGFAHLGAILDYAGLHGMRLCYLKNDYVEMLRPGFVAYISHIMEIYARGWSELVFRLPGFTYEEKLKHFRKRTEISGMLNNKVLLSAHSQGAFTCKDLKENYQYIKLYNRSPYWVLLLISVFPKKIGLLLRKLYKQKKQL